MIEIKKANNTDNINLFIDGVLIEGVNVSKYSAFKFDALNNHSFYYEISTKDKKIAEDLINHRLEEFPFGTKIQLINFFEWLNEYHLISFEVIEYEQRKLEFHYYPDMLKWRYGYSLVEYSNNIEEYIKKNSPFSGDFTFIDSIQQGGYDPYFIVSFILDRTEYKIGLEIQHYLNFLKICHENINNKFQSNLLLATFSFPDKLKTSCEQYLQYFAKFLQDLGINVTSNLNEEAGKILFSVTPIDDIEALDKIREALAVYLNLPSSPIVEYNDSFPAMRLQAEIERLQSSQRIAEMEFRVVHKALESQDKIIFQQTVLLEQQHKIIERITDKSVMINSAENKEELVKVYEGLEAGYSKWIYELTGLKVNFVKIIETGVKNTLGKGEEIIELELDKKD